MKYYFLILSAFCITNSFAQPDDVHAMRFAKFITPEALKTNLYILASDSMEGRETGTEGQRKAAAFIAQEFTKIGLKQSSKTPGYLQLYNVFVDSMVSCTFSINDKKYVLGKDFVANASTNSNISVSDSQLVFAGYGISDSLYDDYKKLDVKNKIVVAINGEPFKKKKFLLSGNGNASKWSNSNSSKIDAAKSHGASGIIFIDTDVDSISQRRFAASRKSRMNVMLPNQTEKSFPNISVRMNIGKEIIGEKNFDEVIKRTKKHKTPKYFELNKLCLLNYEEVQNIMEASNVIGYVEGTDLKEEFIILTAHYDHLGKRDGKIYYGADDDGSGTVSVIEMAKAFNQAKAENHGPRRSVIFMTVSGEEKGLFGSKFYTEQPVFPLENTIVNLNSDMIGRIDELHEKDSNYVYLVGADKMSTELNTISENANSTYTKFKIDYKYNDPKDTERIYYRSDHYNFVLKGIPIIFYFDGIHKDYHKPTDTPDKINYDLLAKRARLVFYTAWELANRAQRLVVDKRVNEE